MATALSSLEVPERIAVGDKEYSTHLLLPSEDIQSRVDEMGAELGEHYLSRGGVHVVTVLSGALHFASDLRRAMQRHTPGLPITSGQVSLSSYTGTQSSGIIRNRHKSQPLGIQGRDVLFVEDILDTGGTLSWLLRFANSEEPSSVEVAVAVNKDNPDRRADLLGETVVHSGFKIENEFVIGYGLDLDERYRDVESIYALRPEE